MYIFVKCLLVRQSFLFSNHSKILIGKNLGETWNAESNCKATLYNVVLFTKNVLMLKQVKDNVSTISNGERWGTLATFIITPAPVYGAVSSRLRLAFDKLHH